MKSETYRTWAEIDLDAYRHNFRIAKELTEKKIMCVIKGDAHGHGAVEAGKVLQQEGAAAFGVACLEEALELRMNGITVPILILGWTPVNEADTLSEYGITQSVMSVEYAEDLNSAAESFGVSVDVHIKLDTGMSRTGILAQAEPEKAARAVLEISGLQNLNITGIFTHYAAADMPEKDDFTAWQVENYSKVLAALDRMGFDKDVIHHTGNSASILYHRETYFDMVRMGVMMYGFSPTGVHDQAFDLKPVLTLKTRVAQVKELPTGAHVSYGCTFCTERPTRIAVAAAGYADSYPRSLSNKGAYAVINGFRCPQVGRICMDMCMFDITDAGEINAGDEIILYGKGGMSLDELAALCGTINCEPTCLLTRRVHKVYLK